MPTQKQNFYVLLITIVSGTCTLIAGLLCYFLLGIKEVVPHLYWLYSVAILINLALFYLHKNLDTVFITTSLFIFIFCFVIACYSGGISSPMFYISPAIIIAGYIMRRQYGRYTALVITLFVVLMYILDEHTTYLKNYVPENAQAAFSLLSIIISIVMLGGVLGDFMAKNSYQVYKAKKFIEVQNQEKEVLITEIHHRVKNNLQIIMSLLKLQGHLIEDKGTLQIFDETRGRIYSMALTHEMLYQGTDLSNVGYDMYIDQLIINLIDSLSLDAEKVKKEIDVPAIKINLNTAIPLGLIINEVITNALKYGVSEDGITYLFLKLEKKENNLYALTIGDKGTGLPPALNLENSPSLGLQLIQLLAEQLDGEIETDSSNGTRYTLLFKSQ